MILRELRGLFSYEIVTLNVADDTVPGMVLLRRRRRGLARLALFAFLCGWMLPFYEAHPLGLADDAACVIAPERNESPSKVEAAVAGASEPSHCYVCHLMRAMSGAVASDMARLVVPFEPSSGPALAGSAPFASFQAAPSSRGPPSQLSI